MCAALEKQTDKSHTAQANPSWCRAPPRCKSHIDRPSRSVGPHARRPGSCLGAWAAAGGPGGLGPGAHDEFTHLPLGSFYLFTLQPIWLREAPDFFFLSFQSIKYATGDGFWTGLHRRFPAWLPGRGVTWTSTPCSGGSHSHVHPWVPPAPLPQGPGSLRSCPPRASSSPCRRRP